MTHRSPFPSFFMGGFECSMPLLPDGRRLDQIAASQHDRQLAGDYRRMREAGLLVVREAVRWPLIDRAGRIDLATLAPVVRALRREGLTAIWDLCHYGYPPDLDPFTETFRRRFADYCAAVAEYLSMELPAPRFYTPVNEISYYSYAGGERGYFAPFARGRADELKRRLVRAALAAIEAIRAVDPSARFLHVDPLIHLVPPADRPDLAPEVERFNRDVVFESWRMLSGQEAPELGGSEAALDLVGVNLYRLCQWEYGRSGSFLERHDPRWMPVREMLRVAWERLRRPLIIAETGENGPRRAGWLRYLFAETQAARAAGVPVLGICWYPVISAPDWHDPTAAFPAGLWDVVPERAPSGWRLRRTPHLPALEVLRACQQSLGERAADLEALRREAPVRPEKGVGRPAAPGASGPAPAGVAQLRCIPAASCPIMPENFGRRFLVAGERLAVSAYCFQPGQTLSVHSYLHSDAALCVLEGEVLLHDETDRLTVRRGEVVVVPAAMPFGISNPGSAPALVLQVAAPRPWSAEFQGPEPATALLGAAGSAHGNGAAEGRAAPGGSGAPGAPRPAEEAESAGERV